MSRPFQTDALNPSSLPTASLGRPKSLRGTLDNDNTVPAGERQKLALDKAHEEWNVRIDREVRAVTTSLGDLVGLANSDPETTTHDPTLQALHLQSKTAQLIRAAQNIRDMAHELKLILVLSDEPGTVRGRDGEMRAVRAEVEGRRREVGEEVVKLLRPGEIKPSKSTAGTVGPIEPSTTGPAGGLAGASTAKDQTTGAGAGSSRIDLEVQADEKDEILPSTAAAPTATAAPANTVEQSGPEGWESVEMEDATANDIDLPTQTDDAARPTQQAGDPNAPAQADTQHEQQQQPDEDSDDMDLEEV